MKEKTLKTTMHYQLNEVTNMTKNNPLKITQIFSATDVHHELSRIVGGLIIEQEGKILTKCQIKGNSKVSKPEEIVRQLWVYRLLNEYNYP
ncbi:MAG: hypothetical protein ACP5JR_07145, partial [Thermoplasmata archaeon]